MISARPPSPAPAPNFIRNQEDPQCCTGVSRAKVDNHRSPELFGELSLFGSPAAVTRCFLWLRFVLRMLRVLDGEGLSDS